MTVFEAITIMISFSLLVEAILSLLQKRKSLDKPRQANNLSQKKSAL